MQDVRPHDAVKPFFYKWPLRSIKFWYTRPGVATCVFEEPVSITLLEADITAKDAALLIH